MRRIGWIDDSRFDAHDAGAGHPDRVERLSAIREEFTARGLRERLIEIPGKPATSDQLERVHAREYISRVVTTCRSGAPFLDSMDVAIVPESEQVARLASGSAVQLAHGVMRGEIDAGFAALRPPGHHAEVDLAMGFCLYNHAAVVARELQRSYDIERVLIADWDVHHGNGTQHIFESDPSVFYFSCHQMPLFPGTGARSETGRGKGVGATLNCPLDIGQGDTAFLETLRQGLVPAMERFKPEFVLISAGFDAHAADPLAHLEVSTESFGEATRILLQIAKKYSGGRLVSLLEGGYEPVSLAQSSALHVETLLRGS